MFTQTREVKDKVHKAYVKKKEEAKTVYDKAVQGGKSAGHVSLDARDSNQFSVSVNIEAQGKVTFNLTYEQFLARNLGVYTNIININPQQIVEDMSVTVNIEEPFPIKDLEVTELQVSNGSMVNKPNLLAKIEEKDPNHKTVVWTPTPEEQKSGNTTGLSCQFVVKYDVDRTGKGQQKILVNEGYFIHFFAPENLRPLTKHVIFVLDYSYSMRGRKREQLEDAMYTILSDLDVNDYFSIVIFHAYVEAWSPTSIYSTDPYSRSTDQPGLDVRFVIKATPTNIAAAHSYLKNYQDLGSTNIMAGLRTGLKLVTKNFDFWYRLQPIVVFLTDGQPNVEETNPNTIVKLAKSLNIFDCPIFSLAFGDDADFNFLRKLSLSNNAFARKIYEAADASDQLNNFYKTISSPLLSNVTFSYSPEQVDYSARTKHYFEIFFNGSEITVAGKINNKVKEMELIGVLSAYFANGIRQYPIFVNRMSIPVKPNIKSVGHLEKMWAYLKIQQLLDKADSLDGSNEINKTKEEALELSLQYSFVTPLTSLVVVKPNETESTVDPAGDVQPHTVKMPRRGRMRSRTKSRMPLLMHTEGTTALPEILDTTTPLPDEGVKNISWYHVSWIYPLLVNVEEFENSTSIPILVEGVQYNLGLNQTDIPFGECQVDGETGDCQHFQYCALNVFRDEVTAYLPYQCAINGNFLGVCCPKSLTDIDSFP